GELARHVPSAMRAFAAGALAGVGALGSSPDRIRKASAAFRDPETLPHAYFFTRLLFTPETVASNLRGDSPSWDTTPWWRWLADSARQAHLMDHFTAVS